MGVLADDGRAEAAERRGYEEIERFGGQEALFGCRHMPVGETGVPVDRPTAALVVCSPWGTDADINAQREARLGRWLSHEGLVVQRFHYRGTGESDGDPARISFASMVDDTRQVVQHLADRCGIDEVALLGTRVGALVAARVARDLADAPLVLWQPVVDPRTYLDDAVAVAASEGRPQPELLELPLGQELFSPTVVDNLVDLLGVRPRPVLLVQLHRRVGLAPELRSAVGRWQARGFDVEVAYDPTEDDWWRVHEAWDPSDEVLQATISWLVGRMAVPSGDTEAAS